MVDRSLAARFQRYLEECVRDFLLVETGEEPGLHTQLPAVPDFILEARYEKIPVALRLAVTVRDGS